MSILQKIVEKKRDRLVSAQARSPMAELKARIKDIEKPRNFQSAIARGSGEIAMIAEIKKASPSKGFLRADFDHLGIASIYESKKVNAISVITEEDFFHGKDDFLRDARKIVTMPVLRKDFIVNEYQIYEARTLTADAVLLIAAILESKQAEDYLHIARGLGMSVLFEIHDERELDMALSIDAPIIGINNRDLSTFRIDLKKSLEMKKRIPGNKIVVSESGIRTRNDVEELQAAGIDAMLVGTCLIESDDIGKKIEKLRGW